MDPDDILRDLLTEENHGLHAEIRQLRARVAELEAMEQRARNELEDAPGWPLGERNLILRILDR